MIFHKLPEVAKIIGRIPKDADFAGVVALTKTAKLIQSVVKEQAQKKFNLKNAWVLRGIRITPATKAKIQAEVFTLDKNLSDQDKGATRSSARAFLIPGKQFKKITGVDPKRKVIPRRFRRKLLLSKTTFPIKIKPGGRKGKKKAKSRARPFEFTAKSGASMIGIRRTSASSPIGVLYLQVHDPINIRGRQFFQIPAGKEYDRAFQKEYDLAFDRFVKLK